MKKNYLLLPVLAAASTLSVMADDTPLDKPSDKSLDKFMDRLTFSGRFGLNINAKFGSRTAPGGGTYNYLDGYVHNDSTGNFDPTGTFPDGITQNWGSAIRRSARTELGVDVQAKPSGKRQVIHELVHRLV